MIHERGYWTSTQETDTHRFDGSLCVAISELIKNDLKTVIDIGCGNGAYTNAFNSTGFDCTGYDGSPLTPELTNNTCHIKDFSETVDLGKFDLVLCLEVGEHIPLQYEQTFIDNLCRAAKNNIVLSWALVGQGGDGHVNCRNNDYVITEMAMRGFKIDIEKSNLLRSKATLSWFKNTIMYFKK
ncbi:unnamed protein product [marine sediment metagenome]|uniref:Methyltransferase type 11 domain-containing protein n=1 Tax=marine sediment metagenome TaxID=412755 RepID=X1AYI8_9ZZZZ